MTMRNRLFAPPFVFLLVLLFAGFEPVQAESITKQFEIGLGTSQTHSHMRTFHVPCGLPVTATVKFQRHGPDNAASDVPIKIDLRKPDTGPDQEGPIAKTENALAKRAQQTVTVASPENSRGCARPWRVRVRHSNDGAAPLTVYGSITVTFRIGNPQTMNIGEFTFLAKKHGTSTRLLGGSSDLRQGKIEITATWIHFISSIYPLPGPFPIPLRFELIDPSGNIVASDQGYSRAEIDPANKKMKIVHQVVDCTTGQWKLRVTNLSSLNDAADVKTKATFIPDCPN